MSVTATEKLHARWAEGKFLCVGLDSDFAKLPVFLRDRYIDIQVGDKTSYYTSDAIFAFNMAIVDATKDIVAAYKPNLAFYLKYGTEGILALQRTVEYILQSAPGVLIILDAKFGDIGNTNDGYASFAFDYLSVDALTIHSYMGRVANQPFLDRADKLFFALCRTSNEGAGEFQNLSITPTDDPLFLRVARKVQDEWNDNGNCGLVTGATAPVEIQRVRVVAPNAPLLIPGIGAQGGELELSVRYASTEEGGFLINSSRGIIFASKGEDFAEAAFDATEELDSQICEAREAVYTQKGWS